MKILLKSLIFCWLIILLSNCEEDKVEGRDYPRLNTLEVSQISPEGATFSAEITYRGDFTILRYGFVWSETETPVISSSDRVIYAENIQERKFSSKIATTLEEGVIYHVRPFVATDDYLVYGNNVEFLSLGSAAPVVTGFAPTSASWGDTVWITGKNFSYRTEKNEVYFGDTPAEVLSATDSLMAISVPPGSPESTVDIAVGIIGNVTTSPNRFTYTRPQVSSIFPLKGTFLDTITVRGTSFGKKASYNQISLSGIEADIVSVSNSEIRFLVPKKLVLKENQLSLILAGAEFNHPQKFILLPPEILSFEPRIITRPLEEVRISGNNFSPISENNQLKIGGFPVKILEVEKNMLRVQLPWQIIPHLDISVFDDFILEVEVAQQSAVAAEFVSLNWHSTWTRKNNFPGMGRQQGIAFSANGKGYFGTGLMDELSPYQLLSDFWEYNPATDTWTQLDNFPGGPRAGAVAFTLNDNGFVGLGSVNYYWNDPAKDRDHFADFYNFDPNQKKWTRLNDFGGIGRHSASAFTLGGKGFVATGWWGLDTPGTGLKIARDTWRYEPATDQWSRVQDFPLAAAGGAAFTIGDVAYVYHSNNLYRYQDDSWAKVVAPDIDAREIIAFSLNGKGYYGLGETNSYWGSLSVNEFTPESSGENQRYSLSDDYERNGASAFVIGNKAYIIGGKGYDNRYVNRNDVWEFDPTRPRL